MKQPRILIVDDERSLLVTLCANLELEGMEVTTADNGKSALELIRRQTFDLVLSDVRMPGMNGVELFREIRKLAPSMPVILMTAFAMESLIDEALREGAFAVLPKPFTIEQVLPVLLAAARQPTVLIIDADTEAARAATLALQAVGVRAQVASDESSAYKALAEVAIDVCVIELGMAGSGNPALISRLKTIEPALSFIALSGHDIPELLRKLTVNTAISWLRKPVDNQLLVHSIAMVRGHRVVRR